MTKIKLQGDTGSKIATGEKPKEAIWSLVTLIHLDVPQEVSSGPFSDTNNNFLKKLKGIFLVGQVGL